MGMARYAFRVRGPASDAMMTALQEGLKVEVDPASTAVHCWPPATRRSHTPSRRRTAA